MSDEAEVSEDTELMSVAAETDADESCVLEDADSVERDDLSMLGIDPEDIKQELNETSCQKHFTGHVVRKFVDVQCESKKSPPPSFF